MKKALYSLGISMTLGAFFVLVPHAFAAGTLTTYDIVDEGGGDIPYMNWTIDNGDFAYYAVGSYDDASPFCGGGSNTATSSDLTSFPVLDDSYWTGMVTGEYVAYVAPPGNGAWTPVGSCVSDFDGIKAAADAYIVFHFDSATNRISLADDGISGTHIIGFNTPEAGSTAPTTDVDFSFTWKQDTPTATHYGLRVFQAFDGVSVGGSGDLQDSIEDFTMGTSTGINTEEFSLTLSPGSYNVYVQLLQEVACTGGGCPVEPIVSNIGSEEFVSFNVIINQFPTNPQWGGTVPTYASSSCQLSWSLDFNIGDCMGYLFVPQPTDFGAYGNFKTAIASKFPFSYFFSIKATWDTLQVGAADQSPTWSMDFHDLGIGSTTSMGNFLPNQVIFSASTTKQYFGDTLFGLYMALFSATIWISFFTYIFFDIKHLLSKP